LLIILVVVTIVLFLHKLKKPPHSWAAGKLKGHPVMGGLRSLLFVWDRHSCLSVVAESELLLFSPVSVSISANQWHQRYQR
jgi:hypothetical protein